ncbi:MAG: ribosome biogenesis GTPase YqeH [Erysipelotrichaceae bacterium]|nr:ribosome biogenesis GTPase YqeH [Erysipelotrichaceae bacterium]MDD4642170.1 ribosome biogenesis GTPase YqeH [Erysipelotrichaceae bacterium]
MSKCKGCGVTIQNDDPNAEGYSPKIDSFYCQRCYRLINYGDLLYSAKTSLNSSNILTKANQMNALILWVVDLFDLESALQESINRFLPDKDIIMIATKRDLLPKSLSNIKLGNYLLARVKENNIKLKGIVVVGKHAMDGKEEILKAIKKYRNDRDVVIVGNTNAGKSTILKNVFNIEKITISRYPGTTLDYMKIPINDYYLYDTPGFNRNNNLQILINDKDLKMVVPNKRIKPIIYQLQDDQTISLGGIIRIDLLECDKVSCVCYFSENLLIHRSKTSNADELWQKQHGKLLKPTLNAEYEKTVRKLPILGKKFDVVIYGLGWFCISGKLKEINISGSEKIEIITRKAMI